jgi:dihydroorotate dehydrogenase
MGFNNLGVDHLLARVAPRYKGVLGINIGKNFDTPVERAVDDYLICLDKVYAHASYVTVNVSSPNTPGLRSLQFGDSLKQLLDALASAASSWRCARQARATGDQDRPGHERRRNRAGGCCADGVGMDAVIATNTTLGREGVEGCRSVTRRAACRAHRCGEEHPHVKVLAVSWVALPIIAAGGITEGKHAAEKIAAGASLVQIYSGFIYKGRR